MVHTHVHNLLEGGVVWAYAVVFFDVVDVLVFVELLSLLLGDSLHVCYRRRAAELLLPLRGADAEVGSDGLA